jgi:hypothetical protein
MIEELAPVGTLQTVLARRVAVAAWRLARADRVAAGTGLGPRRRTERGWGPVPQPVRRRPTRRPTGRAVCGASVGGRRRRARPDPGRQRHPQLRDPAALSRCGHGRVLARAQDAQGAPGRAGLPLRCRQVRIPQLSGPLPHQRPESRPARCRTRSRRGGTRTNPGGKRNRTNPSAPPRASWHTCRASQARAAVRCTSPPPRG